MEIAENQSDTQFLQYQDEYKRQVLGQRKAVEKFLNACLFERVSSEKKFNYLSHLVPQLNKAIEKAFQQEFQKSLFDNVNQIIKKFNFEFLDKIENDFDKIALEVIKEALQDRC